MNLSGMIPREDEVLFANRLWVICLSKVSKADSYQSLKALILSVFIFVFAIVLPLRWSRGLGAFETSICNTCFTPFCLEEKGGNL